MIRGKGKNRMQKAVFLIMTSLLCFCLSGPAFGFWKEKVTRNQIRVVEYVTKLQQGAKPADIERPGLRRDDNYQAKRANNELRKIMDEAEKLANEGKHDLIEIPEFTVRGLSDERAEEMFEEAPPVKQ